MRIIIVRETNSLLFIPVRPVSRSPFAFRRRVCLVCLGVKPSELGVEELSCGNRKFRSTSARDNRTKGAVSAWRSWPRSSLLLPR